MSEDFFGDLGRSISKVTRRAMGRTGSLIESTRLGTQISGEEKTLSRLYAELGELVYERCRDGRITPDEVMAPLIEELTVSLGRIRGFTAELAEVKGMRLCRKCGALIEDDVLFCPKCGTAAADAAAYYADDEKGYDDDDDLEVLSGGADDEAGADADDVPGIEFVRLSDDADAPSWEDL